MGHEFELPQEALVEADPGEVWEAISTGPGMDSWFMGRTEVTGGVVRTAFGGFALPESTVTAAEPGKRFAHGSTRGEDGRFVAYEFLIEGRGRGSTHVRLVTSGFLPGDDWQDEFEAMSRGMEMYFATLVERLGHFAGRAATPVTEFGPPVGDWPRAWELLHTALGGPPSPGDRVRFGPGPVEGVVYFRNSQTLGIRADHAIYRFLQGFHGPMIAAHLLFDDAGAGEGEGERWRAWLGEPYAQET
ncbi:SRPBCC domain-containing protein [Nonomuraea longispora]|uniref:SRPBCC domain-containing protein n=1 Tax=Nonomuraea longispora TaxID=1848320 RepID=A0A4R4NMI2_9ACTN|nr:SRPBCC domain-containing protein [Nonomuraea longispora]TDC09043.1 SRPBCC domain-containing protein [Nonomuraea longispora]